MKDLLRVLLRMLLGAAMNLPAPFGGTEPSINRVIAHLLFCAGVAGHFTMKNGVLSR